MIAWIKSLFRKRERVVVDIGLKKTPIDDAVFFSDQRSVVVFYQYLQNEFLDALLDGDYKKSEVLRKLMRNVMVRADKRGFPIGQLKSAYGRPLLSQQATPERTPNEGM